MDNNHKMNEEELSQVAGGITLGEHKCPKCGNTYYVYATNRPAHDAGVCPECEHTRTCKICGKKYRSPTAYWDPMFPTLNSYDSGLCNDCKHSSALKKVGRGIKHIIFRHDYNKD